MGLGGGVWFGGLEWLSGIKQGGARRDYCSGGVRGWFSVYLDNQTCTSRHHIGRGRAAIRKGVDVYGCVHFFQNSVGVRTAFLSIKWLAGALTLYPIDVLRSGTR